MRAVRIVAQIIGVMLVVFGGFFALQGLGVIMWPADSFMLADRSWVLYGGLILLVGTMLVWWGRRRRV